MAISDKQGNITPTNKADSTIRDLQLAQRHSNKVTCIRCAPQQSATVSVKAIVLSQQCHGKETWEIHSASVGRTFLAYGRYTYVH